MLLYCYVLRFFWKIEKRDFLRIHTFSRTMDGCNVRVTLDIFATCDDVTATLKIYQQSLMLNTRDGQKIEANLFKRTIDK